MTPLQEYLATASVWEVLDIIVAEFKSDPRSVQCFDARLVARAIELADADQAQRMRALGEERTPADLLVAARAAWHALQSYAFGNGSPQLAFDVAVALNAAISNAEGAEWRRY